MKVILSKSQWESIGRTAGWLREIKSDLTEVSGNGGFFFRIVENQDGTKKAIRCNDGEIGSHYCSYTAKAPADPRSGPADVDLDCDDVIPDGIVPTSPEEIADDVFYEEIFEDLKDIAVECLWEDYNSGRL